MDNKTPKNQNAENQNKKRTVQATSSSLKFKFDDRYTRYIGKRSGKFLGQLNPQKKNMMMNRYSDFITYGSDQFTQDIDRYSNIIINCNNIGKVNFTSEQSQQQQQIKQKTQRKIDENKSQIQQRKNQKRKGGQQQFKTVEKPKSNNQQEKKKQSPQISGLPSKFSQQSYRNPFFNLVISSIKKSQPYVVSQQKGQFQDMVNIISQSQNRFNLENNFKQIQQRVQKQKKIDQIDKKNYQIQSKNPVQKYQNKYKLTNNNQEQSPQNKNKKRVTINSVKSVRVTLSNNKYQDFILPEQFRQEARQKYQQEERQRQQKQIQQKQSQNVSKKKLHKSTKQIKQIKADQQLQQRINIQIKLAQSEKVNENGKRERPAKDHKKTQHKKKSPENKFIGKNDNKKRQNIRLQQERKQKIKDQAPAKVKKVHLQQQNQTKYQPEKKQLQLKSRQKNNLKQSKIQKKLMQQSKQSKQIKQTINLQSKNLKKKAPKRVKYSPQKRVPSQQQHKLQQSEYYPQYLQKLQNQQYEQRKTEPQQVPELQSKYNQIQSTSNDRKKSISKKKQTFEKEKQARKIQDNINSQQQYPASRSKRLRIPVAKFWLGEKVEYRCGQFKTVSYKAQAVAQLNLVDKSEFECEKTFVQSNKVCQKIKIYPQQKAVFQGFKDDRYEYLQIKYKSNTIQNRYIKNLQIVIAGFQTDFSKYEATVQKRIPFTIENKNRGSLPLTIWLYLKLN